MWQDATQPDSSRADAYGKFIWKRFMFSNPDTAFILSEKLLAFGIDNKNQEAQSSGYNYLGVSSLMIGEHDKAIEFFTKSAEVSNQMGDELGACASLHNSALVYSDQGDYLKAMQINTQNLKTRKRLRHQSGISASLTSIATLYMKQGAPQMALGYYIQSLKISEEIGNQRSIAIALNNIGSIYNQLQDSKALDYLTKSLEISEQLNDQNAVGATLNNIGTFYHYKGENNATSEDYTEALNYYNRSLEIKSNHRRRKKPFK